MFKGSEPNEIENWTCVMQSGKEYEIELAKNHLDDQEIPANILSKRDSAFSMNVGETALVYLYVPDEYAEEAKRILEEGDIDSESYNEEE